MPTYDYICQACGHEMESFQSITADPLKTCPKCKKDALKRGVGGGSAVFRFVGEGFYVNDSKKCPASGCGCKKDEPPSSSS